MNRQILLCTLLTGCGQVEKPVSSRPPTVPVVNQTVPNVPDETAIQLIVGEFYANAQTLGKKVAHDVKSISFVESFEGRVNTVGLCTLYSSNGKIIYGEIHLLRKNWDEGSTQYRKTLLYHELGHCALRLEHSLPNSGAIMEPVVLAEEFAYVNWYGLVVEEFASSPLGLKSVSDTEGCVEIVIIN